MRDHSERLLNSPMDLSKEFTGYMNNYFNATCVSDYNDNENSGNIKWNRYSRKVRCGFNQVEVPMEPSESWEFPPEYDDDFTLPFSIDFINDRTIRLQFNIMEPYKVRNMEEDSLMLIKKLDKNVQWNKKNIENGIEYSSYYGKLRVFFNPFDIEMLDKKGKLLTRTQQFSEGKELLNSDPTSFSIVRRYTDLKRFMAASFISAHDEKIFGCGESFTKLDKKGQKVVLSTYDAHGAQTPDMYKPIPFFMSNKGYGMFVHTTTPITFDFGRDYDNANTIITGDHKLDMFIFIGSPKEIIAEYTDLTGKSPVPPLWSFGLWMSRITYKSETEVRDVAKKLRDYEIPCDVIHIDTGWFENDWRCDYQFSKQRFNNPQKMIEDLRENGFRISLWQLPYFTPKNDLYYEIINNGYAVLDTDGILAVEDAIIDFSNPDAEKWYKELIRKLLDLVSAIKVDFGEAAPYHGCYYSGRSGFYEHNLYPLRYNKAVADITKEVRDDSIIWARSAWAGSQRYPIHWGGDAENTDNAMLGTLRAGLSLGLCGFSYWSHDIGGFAKKTPKAIYKRWLPFGMLTSHSRCHGKPPKEPWEYDEAFVDIFKKSVELKYNLMPYIFTEAVKASEQGYPMMRTLFFEYPDDSTAWLIEDEYMFGDRLLVAPLFTEESNRKVYLPKGKWVDYQTNNIYEGEKWYDMEMGELPIIILVKEGSMIPHAVTAQSTDYIDWNNIILKTYKEDRKSDDITGDIAFPHDNRLHKIIIKKDTISIIPNKDIEFTITSQV